MIENQQIEFYLLVFQTEFIYMGVFQILSTLKDSLPVAVNPVLNYIVETSIGSVAGASFIASFINIASKQ